MEDLESSDGEKAYIVEAVRGMRSFGSKREFLIKWAGYEESENSWEPESGVKHLDVLKEFLLARAEKNSDDRKQKEEAARQKRLLAEEAERKKNEELSRRKKEEKRKKKTEEILDEIRNTKVVVDEKKIPQVMETESTTNRCDSEEIPKIDSKQRVENRKLSDTNRALSHSPELETPNKSFTKSVDGRSSSPELSVKKCSNGSNSTSPGLLLLPKQTIVIDGSSSESEDSDDSLEQFAVRKVLNVKGNAPFREFFVQWEGYGSEDDTWEPESGVGHLDVVQEFLAAKEKKSLVAPSSSGFERKRRAPSPSSHAPKFDQRGSKTNKSSDGAGYSNFFNRGFKHNSTGHPSKKDLFFGGGKTKERKQSATNVDGESDGFGFPNFGPEDEVTKKLRKFKIPQKKSSKNETPGSKPPVSVKPIDKTSSGSNPVDEEVELEPTLSDEAIRKAIPQEDPKLFKLIMNSEMRPVVKRDPEECHSSTQMPKFVPSLVSADRFSDLHKRIQHLKLEARQRGFVVRREDEQRVPAPVTHESHALELSCRLTATANANQARNVRVEEIVGNYEFFFRTKIFPEFLRKTDSLKPGTPLDPGGITFGKEIPLFLRGQFNFLPVMLHLGRDVQTYNREKNRRQKCLKQVQRPPRF